MISSFTDRFQTRSLQFESTLVTATKIAKTINPVLIFGEKGTGKREMALFIAENSDRSKNPFVRISFQNFQTNLIDHTGTVLLENLQDFSVTQQNELLKLISLSFSKGLKSETRWISTATPEIHQKVKSGDFNLFLFQALSTEKLYMPSLMERSEDVPFLVDSYIDNLNLFSGKVKKVDSSVFIFLKNKKFTENVTELFTFLDDLYVKADDEFLKIESPGKTLKIPAGISLSEMEKKLILQTLEFTNQNRTKAAEILGISIRTLRNKLSEYRLEAHHESTIR